MYAYCLFMDVEWLLCAIWLVIINVFCPPVSHEVSSLLAGEGGHTHVWRVHYHSQGNENIPHL